MKITALFIGKTDKNYIREGIEEYSKRVGFYLPFELKIIPDIKRSANLTEDLQREKEGKMILEQIDQGDQLILLDEKGTEFTSLKLADWLEKRMIAGTRRLIFAVGGPYGFSKEVLERADFKISLSRLTFSHQMVRMIFVEQLYRAMTIIRNEPYHHK